MGTFEQNEEVHPLASQKPHFLRVTLYFFLFHLKDLVKVFLLAMFQHILMTLQYKAAMVSGSAFKSLGGKTSAAEAVTPPLDPQLATAIFPLSKPVCLFTF